MFLPFKTSAQFKKYRRDKWEKLFQQYQQNDDDDGAFNIRDLGTNLETTRKISLKKGIRKKLYTQQPNVLKRTTLLPVSTERVSKAYEANSDSELDAIEEDWEDSDEVINSEKHLKDKLEDAQKYGENCNKNAINISDSHLTFPQDFEFERVKNVCVKVLEVQLVDIGEYGEHSDKITDLEKRLKNKIYREKYKKKITKKAIKITDSHFTFSRDCEFERVKDLCVKDLKVELVDCRVYGEDSYKITGLEKGLTNKLKDCEKYKQSSYKKTINISDSNLTCSEDPFQFEGVESSFMKDIKVKLGLEEYGENSDEVTDSEKDLKSSCVKSVKLNLEDLEECGDFDEVIDPEKGLRVKLKDCEKYEEDSDKEAIKISDLNLTFSQDDFEFQGVKSSYVKSIKVILDLDQPREVPALDWTRFEDEGMKSLCVNLLNNGVISKEKMLNLCGKVEDNVSDIAKIKTKSIKTEVPNVFQPNGLTFQNVVNGESVRGTDSKMKYKLVTDEDPDDPDYDQFLNDSRTQQLEFCTKQKNIKKSVNFIDSDDKIQNTALVRKNNPAILNTSSKHNLLQTKQKKDIDTINLVEKNILNKFSDKIAEIRNQDKNVSSSESRQIYKHRSKLLKQKSIEDKINKLVLNCDKSIANLFCKENNSIVSENLKLFQNNFNRKNDQERKTSKMEYKEIIANDSKEMLKKRKFDVYEESEIPLSKKFKWCKSIENRSTRSRYFGDADEDITVKMLTRKNVNCEMNVRKQNTFFNLKQIDF